jgi:hypothetical protein
MYTMLSEPPLHNSPLLWSLSTEHFVDGVAHSLYTAPGYTVPSGNRTHDRWFKRAGTYQLG